MSRRSTGTSANTDTAAAPERRLIVSFHDLHPGSRGTGEEFLRLLDAAGIARATFLVVPCWHGGPPFTRDGAFTAWLRDCADAGHDICLHGYTHHAESVSGSPLARFVGRRYTASEGEFFQIARAEAERRVRDGLALLGGDAGVPVFGFTPPAWLLSAGGREALRAAGLHYTTTWNRVELLQIRASVAAPALVYSCRNAWRRAVSRAWVRVWHRLNRDSPLLRIAVHPGDFADERLIASLRWHLRAALTSGRTAITYRDLLPAGAGPVPPPLAAAA